MIIDSYQIKENTAFVGRKKELQRLREITEGSDQAQIIVVHGRRRTGKTELLEQFFRTERVLKFEGIKGKDEQQQREAFAMQLAEYLGFSTEIQDAKDSWTALLKILSKAVAEGRWIVYLEELQWMAGYKSNLVAELKYVWDNFFRHNKDLVLILCGSSPSFMADHVIRSKSLYSRSMHEIKLMPFSLEECHEFLGAERSAISVLDCYLSVGGIPEYLKYFKNQNSIMVSLCNQSFKPGGYFTSEYDRIFVSSLGDQPIYKEIVNFLANRRFASREELVQELQLSSGGGTSRELEKLVTSGLISAYSPYQAGENSKLVRYCVADEYLQFYAKFILPQLDNINSGVFLEDPISALDFATYRQWLGYSLERLCRKRHHFIAKHLGFSGVKYRAGAYFQRKDVNSGKGFQIDLLFDRQDKVVTVCEIKYLSEKVGTKAIEEMAEKIEQLNLKKKEIQKVLIAPIGIRDSVRERLYFDVVIEAEQLLKM